jgi:hypothetical protein
MLSVLASESFDADGRPQGKNIFGKGGPEPLSLSPSPAGLARRLSDQLFNRRFGAALLVAGLLYSWRFHARKSVFGADDFDYAEAFALGFLVSLAVNELPQRIAELAALKG